MTEIETLKRAKMYIDKLANGINPLDDSKVSDDDIVNNVRISRCFFYVSDVLRNVIENGVSSPKKVKKVPFSISFENAQKFPFSDEAMSVTVIAENINSLIDVETMKKITYKNLTDWLLEVGMLQETTSNGGKQTKRPTEQGREMGIFTEVRMGRTGEYTAVLYNRKAQEFIIDNIDAIMGLMEKLKEEKAKNKES